jgi:hypothetical protein
LRRPAWVRISEKENGNFGVFINTYPERSYRPVRG